MPGSAPAQTITTNVKFAVGVPPLPTLVTVTTVVKDANGVPLPSENVQLTSATFAGGALDGDVFYATATTDATGTARFTVPPGEYTAVTVANVVE
jgi:hypothetical protein